MRDHRAAEIPDNRLLNPVSAQMHVAIDETVRFGWRPDKVVLFDRETGRNLAAG